MIQVNEHISCKYDNKTYYFHVFKGAFGYYLRTNEPQLYGNDKLLTLVFRSLTEKDKFCNDINPFIECNCVFPECPSLEILEQFLIKLFSTFHITSNIDYKLYGTRPSIF